MPQVTTSTRQRVENATREAHLRAVLAALNAWAKEPHTLHLRRAVGAKMSKYQAAIERGLFTPNKRSVFRRDAGDSVSDASMMEAVELLLECKQPMTEKHEVSEMNTPPW